MPSYLFRAVFAASWLLASTWVSAEVVMVKYAGPVDLSGMVCEDTQSSFVHRVCYRGSDGYVVTLLRDTYYHYCRMPAAVISAWVSAPSVGRFYNANIKGMAAYDCRLK